MASKRLLKRDVNYVMGDIIDAAYIHQMANPEDASKTEAIVDEAIADFDELIVDDRLFSVGVAILLAQ